MTSAQKTLIEVQGARVTVKAAQKARGLGNFMSLWITDYISRASSRLFPNHPKSTLRALRASVVKPNPSIT